MHKSAMFYGKCFFETYCPADFSGKVIVDIGAQNVNGSLRELSPKDASYIGVDFVEGNGVDVVLTDPYKLPFDNEAVDVIVCSSVFEHSEFFWLLYLECIRILKPRGIMYLNTPSNGMVHRYPVDSWRFYPDSGHALAKWAQHHHYNTTLLESFVGDKIGPEEGEGMWNDFVCVFLKDKSQEDHFPSRIQDHIEIYYFGYDSRTPCDSQQFGYLPDLKLLNEKNIKIDLISSELSASHNKTKETEHKLEEISTENKCLVESQKNLLSELNASQNKNKEIESKFEEINSKHICLVNSYNNLLNENLTIKNSRSWRITKPLRYVRRSLARQPTMNKKIAPPLINRLWHKLPIPEAQKNIIRKYLKRPLPKLEAPVYDIPKIHFDDTKEAYTDFKNNPTTNPAVKLIAFYLPQFHPFPENDKWWGKGFTEWSNVGKAERNYIGHYQPHCPIHNGYYDLRIPSVMEEQALLAKQYGIYGFSYYFYWFGGEILMDTPLEMMLKNPKVDMPFCLTWANENWTRRWDGQENDVLIAQNHSDEDSIAFIRHLIKYFNDPRYIKIDGKPVLIIYRASIIPNILKTSALWREEAMKHGFTDLYLICAQSFGIKGPEEFGFDAAVEFPPHTVKSHEISSQLQITNPEFEGAIFSYDQVVTMAIREEEPEYKLFRTSMLSWDNTARKQNNSHIFHGFSLLRYKQWLAALCSNVYRNEKYSLAEKLVFVNAWNEWAEGTHLEPDRRYGYGYLQATYDVISNFDDSYETGPTRKNFEKTSDYAVILHLHYLELWPEIKSHLKSLESIGFDLFVTTTDKAGIDIVSADFPRALVEYHENRGRDIFPLTKIINFISTLNYTAVCKIHTKKSVYRNDGDDIRGDLLEALIGDKEATSKIVHRFEENQNLGMIIPESYLTEHTDRNMTFDHEVVQKACGIQNIKFRYDKFPAGSMFWFRPAALISLNKFKSCDFDGEQGLVDGTLPHAIERIFCLIAYENNFTVEVC
ncbi:glycoside hydrolase family 99-like domain-containing protein [Pseudomonas sp. GOM6]|uniref:glycoside hydrolase family 99-like domain-containing protein n=1 Tax=Pseudomonas sp. GOM6 TaxID=3036944 RepID=UPI00240A9065|nr:glycoside hydrolase family 99-like domain-containing protein [Pseudomonas sp. GOM6]MDG1581184.1 glycoside hydrolase family 99-like domain-containing protein [Pseudomonas sp. GOM6]